MYLDKDYYLNRSFVRTKILIIDLYLVVLTMVSIRLGKIKKNRLTISIGTM